MRRFIADENVPFLQNRLLLTPDRDHVELIFSRVEPAPPGVIYFRIPRYRPAYIGELLLDLLSAGVVLEGFFTVVNAHGVRQRKL